MRKIIITDFTRFSKKEILCTAGIEVGTDECIRLMPYLQTSKCRELNMLPGVILTGNFKDFMGEAQVNPKHIRRFSNIRCKLLHTPKCQRA
jgi:hypothetical protein